MYHAYVNVSLMEENIMETNAKISININVRVRNVIHVKKIILGISLHVYAEIVNI